MFQGWGDESGSVRARDPGAFILGAVLAEPCAVDELRIAMRGLQLHRQQKIHWSDESHKRRLQISETLARLPLESVVVVRVGPDGESEERRRRKCFERLAFEVDLMGCGHLTLESRGVAGDRRDRLMLDTMRARKAIGHGFRLDHAAGPADPLLWIADAVCGAVVASRVGDPTYLDQIRSSMTLIRL